MMRRPTGRASAARGNRDNDRGEVAILVATLCIIVGALVAFIIEAGAIITTQSQADTLAAEAARAASSSLVDSSQGQQSTSAANLSTPSKQTDPSVAPPEDPRAVPPGDDSFIRARQAVEFYLAQVVEVSGQQVSASVSLIGPRTMEVRVTVTSTSLLGKPYSRTAWRHADLEQGVNQPAPPGQWGPPTPTPTPTPSSSPPSDPPPSPGPVPPPAVPSPSSQKPAPPTAPTSKPTPKPTPKPSQPTSAPPSSKKPTTHANPDQAGGIS